ncbi:MAG: hypothetical protein JWM89_3496 [Acidimicrobiales bacterium]|nr:hypothetical protein [Acidimicrobiales bacterium]
MINMPGGPELMVIVLIALIVLGPQQLPKAMRTFGTVMAEIRKVSSGFQAEMKSAMDSITDDSPSKPQSGSRSPVDTTSRTAAEPIDADVTEVVARNDATVDETGSATEVEPATAAEATDTRPVIDPVDRAAG